MRFIFELVKYFSFRGINGVKYILIGGNTVLICVHFH